MPGGALGDLLGDRLAAVGKAQSSLDLQYTVKEQDMNADYGEGFDPQQAPRLLRRIGGQAQRVFDGPPWLMSVLRAAVFLVGYGAIWLLVRGQHPYRGPNTAVMAVVFIAVIIATVATVKSLRPPSAGWAQKQKDVRAAALPAYLGTGLLIGALDHAGADRWLVYGVLPATAPLLVVACAWAAAAAARGEWLDYGLCVGLAAAAAIGAFFGPAGVWAVTGIGCAVVVLGHAAAREMVRHRGIAPA